MSTVPVTKYSLKSWFAQAFSVLLGGDAVPSSEKGSVFRDIREHLDLTQLGQELVAGRIGVRAVELYAALWAVAIAEMGEPHPTTAPRVSAPSRHLEGMLGVCERTIDRARRQLIDAGLLRVVGHGFRHADIYELRLSLRYTVVWPVDGTEVRQGDPLAASMRQWGRARLRESAPLLGDVELRVLQYLWCGGMQQGAAVQRSATEAATYLSVKPSQFWGAVRTLEALGCVERCGACDPGYVPLPFRRTGANQYRVRAFAVGIVRAAQVRVAELMTRDRVRPEYPGYGADGTPYPNGYASDFTRIMQDERWRAVSKRFSWRKWLSIMAAAGVV